MLPFILLALAATATVGGVAAGISGASDLSDASDRVEAAKARHARGLASLVRRRVAFNADAVAWGERQVKIGSTTLRDFVRLVHRIGRQGDVRALELLRGLDVTPARVAAYEATVEDALRIGRGLVNAGGAGGAAYAGTTALVGLLGTASTGAAIGGLSGAAAESATLAFLGGGAISAGGGGVALGSVVLGGIVIAPVALIAGFVLAAEGEQALTRARQFEAEVAVEIAKTKTIRGFLHAAGRRMAELRSLADDLDRRSRAALAAVPRSFDSADRDHVERFRQAALLVKALSDVLRVPVLDRDGSLSRQPIPVTARYTAQEV